MYSDRLKRREFITLLGGMASGWPLVAGAQQPERMRRIGVLSAATETDPNDGRLLTVFRQALQNLGWIDGRTVLIDTRWAAGDLDRARKYAAELVALTPDVILAGGGSVVGLLPQEVRSVPIVFTLTPDPVGAGFVESLAQPGGNATGFTLFEYGIGGKWLDLLKEIAPGIRRAAVVRDPALPQGTGLFGAIQTAASSLGVELTPVNVRDASEIERAIAVFARSPHGGLIVTASILAVLHRDLLVTLAAQQKLPAIYFHQLFVAAGGLISYGPDFSEQYARAAGYVDRILRGAKPADLPVQNPTKYELVINLKTAKAISLTVPDKLLTIANDVIE
jgi:putative ABC transport system substrate-binding protein